MDGPPTQTLGVGGAERNMMKRKSVSRDILNKNVIIKITVAGIVMAIGTLGSYVYQLNIGTTTKEMSIAFAMFVVYQLFNTYKSKANSNKKKYTLLSYYNIFCTSITCNIYIKPANDIQNIDY